MRLFPDKALKRYERHADLAMVFWERFRRSADGELRDAAAMLRQRARDGETMEQLQAECHALLAETARRSLDIPVFRTHFMAACALGEGKLARITYADGKNVAALFAAILFALSGRKVFLLANTAEEVRRNADWYGKLARFLGVSVGAVYGGLPEDDRAAAYDCELVYAAASVYAVDAVRHLARPLDFAALDRSDCAVVDGASSILIDNAAELCRFSDGGAERSLPLAAILRRFVTLSAIAYSVAGEEDAYRQLYGLETVLLPSNRPRADKLLPDRLFASPLARDTAIVDWAARRLAESAEPSPDGEDPPALIINTMDQDSHDRIAVLLSRRGLRYEHYSVFAPAAQQQRSLDRMILPGTLTLALHLEQNRLDPDESYARERHMRCLELVCAGHGDSRRRDEELFAQVGHHFSTVCFFCAIPEEEAQRLSPLRGAARRGEISLDSGGLRRRWDAVTADRQAEYARQTLSRIDAALSGKTRVPVPVYGWDSDAGGRVAHSELPVYEGDKPHIFISYAHDDSEAVGPLIQILQENGFRVWWDLGIRFGESWESAIYSHIDGCAAVLAFVSRTYLSRRHTNRELDYASAELAPPKDCLLALIQELELPDRYITRFGKNQYADSTRYDSVRAYARYLMAAPALQLCREE